MRTLRLTAKRKQAAFAFPLFAVVACQSAPTGATVPTEKAVPTPPSLLPLEYSESMTGHAGANGAEPLIVALHGLGDTPQNFASVFTGFPADARLVAPDSGVRFGDGFQWFSPDVRPTSKDGAEIARMTTMVVAFIEAAARLRPTLGEPIVVGFSQGAALAYAVAALHPSAVSAAFPVSGWFPESLFPTVRPSLTPLVSAFHGTADTRVPLERGRAATAELTSLGYAATLNEFDGVRHEISGAERARLFELLAARCEVERRKGILRAFNSRRIP